MSFFSKYTKTLTLETFWQDMMLQHPFIHAPPSRLRRQQPPSPGAPTEEGGGGSAKSAAPLRASSSPPLPEETMEQSRPATSAQGMQGMQGRGGGTSTGTGRKNLLEWKLSRPRRPQTSKVFSSINHVNTTSTQSYIQKNDNMHLHM